MKLELTEKQVKILKQCITAAWKGGHVASSEAAKNLLEIEEKLGEAPKKD